MFRAESTANASTEGTDYRRVRFLRHHTIRILDDPCSDDIAGRLFWSVPVRTSARRLAPSTAGEQCLAMPEFLRVLGMEDALEYT